MGRGPGRGQGQGLKKKTPRPGPLTGAGQGIEAGARRFRGPGGPVTNTRENLPTADEVSMILPEEYGSTGFRDIVLASRMNGEDRDNPFTLINPNHASYLPLHYVLLFPYGEPGWHWGRTLNNCEGDRQNKNLSQRTFYRFHLHPRVDEPSTIFCAEKLFQQFVVDA